MATTTSDHVKPCNIGSSEAHNRRTPEYLKHIGKEKFYIRTELTPLNSSWVSSLMEGKDLTAYYNDIARMVKEKTGRAMQTKERTIVNKKTGKTKTINGSSPLRESVVVCKPDTTIDQLRSYCDRCHERWGITALQIFIHQDEGHYGVPGDNSTWKPNCHAHIVWDWMNHETGKSFKLGKEDMSLMQDMVAESLDMERGTRKEETGKNHLERTDFIIAKQRQEAENAKAEMEKAVTDKKEAEAELRFIKGENEAKEIYRQSLDSEIADKEKQLKDERKARVDSILDGVGSLLGVGKSAAIEKENAKLKAENERIRKAFLDAVKKDVKKQTNTLTSEKQNVEAERDKALAQNRLLTIERNKAISQLKSQQKDEQQRVEMAVKLANSEKDKTINLLRSTLKTSRQVLNIIADMLYAASDIFKRAVDAIIHYGTEKYKSVFGNDEAADIKNVMEAYGKTKEQYQAVGSWLCDYAESRQPFEETKHRQTYKEVADVANGAYDRKIERGQRGSISI